MYQTVEMYLLALIVPAIALLAVVFFERRRGLPGAEPPLAKDVVAHPKFKVMRGRKR